MLLLGRWALGRPTQALLMPLLDDLLDLHIGQTDVAVTGLECREGAVLVY